ncbi:MAG: type II toxin-antitoxin system RelE/ParE family toxin [Candidatus Blackburnbacteria bacterium]|nr:type II toxin-antitoxin system RelE/ParE family toxin [Candidatus Blackburnbacteria bacterium]
MVSYKLKLTIKFIGNLRKIPEKYQRSLKEAIEEIKEVPFGGKPLTRELAGRRTWHVGRYRIIYGINEKDGVITLFNVDLRAVAYN